jgi:tetratricopeptide (TPR) repeat protein
MRSAFRITDNPLSSQGCSCGTSFAPKEFGQEGSSSDDKQKDEKKGSAGSKIIWSLSFWATVRGFFGFGELDLDEDPTKNKVKQAMLYRKYGQYERAILTLEDALEDVKKIGKEPPITRVLYEIALTRYMQGDMEQANQMFRFVVTRFVKHTCDYFFLGSFNCTTRTTVPRNSLESV